jgi:hypothetical protein
VPEQLEARVVSVENNRTVYLDAGQESGVEVGMRFQILDTDGREVGLVKIVEVSSDQAIGHRFDSFVGSEALSREQRSSTAVGAGVGAALGTMVAGGVIGGAVGAIIGGTFAQRMARPPMLAGMRAVQVVGGKGLPTISHLT